MTAPVRASDPDRIPGSYLVELRPGVSTSQAADIAADHGGRAVHTYRRFGGFSFEGSDQAAPGLAADQRVRRVEADRVVRVADDPTADLKHLTKTDAYTAYGAGYTGAGIRIAIIDTGVFGNHPVFSGHNNVVSGKSCTGGDTSDGEGHGTASASNAAGRIGIAHEATIVPVKVFKGASLATSIAKVICGLDWVESANTNVDPLDDIDVVNMSLAFSGSNTALNNAVQDVRSSGAVVVAAAGNNGGGTQAPAKFAGVIAVTALGGGTKMASFSANGGDLTAPGVKIKSAENGGGYSNRSGTSRSSPMVAGAVAIILAEDAAADVEAVLQASGRCPNDEISGSPGFCGGKWKGDDSQAEPLLNAYCAGIFADAEATDVPNCGF